MKTSTDCRSEVGVTVGLVDAIIVQARVLAERDLTDPAVQEALKDLREDEDLAQLLDGSKPRRRTPRLRLEVILPSWLKIETHMKVLLESFTYLDEVEPYIAAGIFNPTTDRPFNRNVERELKKIIK